MSKTHNSFREYVESIFNVVRVLDRSTSQLHENKMCRIEIIENADVDLAAGMSTRARAAEFRVQTYLATTERIGNRA